MLPGSVRSSGQFYAHQEPNERIFFEFPQRFLATLAEKSRRRMTEERPPIKTTNRIGAYIIHSGIAAVLSSFAVIARSWTFNSPTGPAKSPLVSSGRTVKVTNQPKTASFADRVAYQRAIEEVYLRGNVFSEKVLGLSGILLRIPNLP
jgi:hypothetical protein